MAIQFPLYEQIKLYYSMYSANCFFPGVKPSNFQSNGIANDEFLESTDSNDLPSSRILVASACSKMLASVITYPHEVLRTRLQVHRLEPPSSCQIQPVSSSHIDAISSSKPESRRTKLVYPRMKQTFNHIMKTEGISGFYHGLGVNLIRTVPNSALTILT